MEAMKDDFTVASNGHCFCCLNKIITPRQNLSSPLVTQIKSLQYFSRYLKMDMKKVFLDKGQVSPELLAKVEKARLKVQLCEECNCLNERFSVVYRQLEKLEMELVSTLELIHGKLVGAHATGKLRGLTTGLNSNWKGLLEVVDVLRAEAILKSSHKLAGTSRVKIQKLSKREIPDKPSRLENEFRCNYKQAASQLAINSGLQSDFKLETNDVQMKSLSDECVSDNINDNGNYLSDDDVDSNPVAEPMKHDEKTRVENIKGKLNAGDKIVTEQTDKMVHTKVVSRPTRQRLDTSNFSINPKTGRRKCNDCQLEFNSYQAFDYHYRSAHLKMRYKCVPCNKLFCDNSTLRKHQRTSRSCSAMESVLKFICHLCAKSFALKHHLQLHLDGVHYRLQKYECNLCEKKFNTDNRLRNHRKQVHREILKR